MSFIDKLSVVDFEVEFSVVVIVGEINDGVCWIIISSESCLWFEWWDEEVMCYFVYELFLKVKLFIGDVCWGIN